MLLLRLRRLGILGAVFSLFGAIRLSSAMGEGRLKEVVREGMILVIVFTDERTDQSCTGWESWVVNSLFVGILFE